MFNQVPGLTGRGISWLLLTARGNSESCILLCFLSLCPLSFGDARRTAMTRGLLSPSPLDVGSLRAQPILNHMVSSTHTFFLDEHIVQFSSVAQSCPTLCDPMDCRGPHGHAHQASLSIANSWSSLKLTSIESVMPSSHPILCHPLLLLPSIFPIIRVFSDESVFCMRWPKYWCFSFSISPSNEYSGLISFRMDRLDLLAVQGTLKSLLQHHSSKASILQMSTYVLLNLSPILMPPSPRCMWYPELLWDKTQQVQL